MKSLLVFLTSWYLASCLPPPHPAVVQVRREEEMLPFHLRSRALWNPHLQEILPLTSLLHDGEQPVYDREAEKVSRQEIYNILTHAGFLPRRPAHHQPDPHHKNHQRIKSKHTQNTHNPHHHEAHPQFGGQFHFAEPFGQQTFEDFFGPDLGNPDYLQYL